MGNRKSKIDLKAVFPTPCPVNKTKGAYVIVNLLLPEESAATHRVLFVYETWARFASGITEEERNGALALHAWEPKSDMHDFEVLHPYTDKEIRIARGQAVGIVIVECLEQYLKVYYDKEKASGFNVSGGRWVSDEQSLDVLGDDLGLGYDVLLVRGEDAKTTQRLFDDSKDDNPLAGKVFVPGLDKSLEKYTHKRSRDPEAATAVAPEKKASH